MLHCTSFIMQTCSVTVKFTFTFIHSCIFLFFKVFTVDCNFLTLLCNSSIYYILLYIFPVLLMDSKTVEINAVFDVKGIYEALALNLLIVFLLQFFPENLYQIFQGQES